MPVCSFFLRGVCIREDCPYLHVCVGKDAEICLDFAKGYCSKGEDVCTWCTYAGCYLILQCIHNIDTISVLITTGVYSCKPCYL